MECVRGGQAEQSDVISSVTQKQREELHRAQAWLKDASAVLVVAGAGFSAGLRMRDEDGWAGLPKPPSSKGMDWARGYHTAEDMWGREGPRLLRTIRGWCKQLNGAFTSLASLLDSKPYFILTSNVDNRFHAAGFDPERIYTPQGDLTVLQCCTPCSGVGIPAEPALTKLIDEGGINETSWLVDREDLMPRCPACGAPAYKWTRHNELFTHGPADAAQAKMIEWLRQQRAGLVVLEVGCGMSTPSVCRFPAEAIARQLQAKFVRVSYDSNDAQVPKDLAQEGRALSCVGAAEAAMAWFANEGPMPVADPAGHAGYNMYGQYIGNRVKFAPANVPWEQWLDYLRDDPSRFQRA